MASFLALPFSTSQHQGAAAPMESATGSAGEAGIEPGDTVVAYCRTGMQASYAYFVSRVLGYETRFYDGSFMDWSRREDLPVSGPATR